MTESLVDIARAAIVAWAHGRTYQAPTHEAVSRPLFVTLHDGAGVLRGCIGHLTPIEGTLNREVAATAVIAATEDPRFPPVTVGELDALRIEVDILGPTELVETPANLDPRRYGVVVSSGIRRGVLLPAIDGVDTPQQQLEIAMHKAGIGPLEPLRIERFEVEKHR